MIDRIETNPYHEMIRQEFLTWFHRKFVIGFERVYNNRHTNPSKISKTMRACKEYGYMVGLQGLISRLLGCATIGSKHSDPIIPRLTDIYYDTDIIDELEFECGLYHEDALMLTNCVVSDLYEASTRCSTMIEKQMFSETVRHKIINSKIELSCSSTPLLKTRLMKIRNENKIKEKMNFVLYKHDNDYHAKVYLNFDHYIKLSKMYERTGSNPAELNIRLFCLVSRYEIYSGNTSGLQGAIPPYIFSALNHLLGIDTECFASPLNCCLENSYFSAFYDTDRYFGSKGTFFGKNYKSINVEEGGKYEVNPPFINCIMDLVVKLIHEALMNYKQLMFFIIVPSWTDAEFYEGLMSSKYLRCSGILESKKHEYVDGLQHRANRTTWKANVNSTWFLVSKGFKIPIGVARQINNAFKL